MSNKVLASFEDQFGSRCVDIFIRENGTFGFEEFRGESDGSCRWQPLGRHAHLSFASGEEALLEAKRRVVWLENTGAWRW
jgi:hypothetical protein